METLSSFLSQAVDNVGLIEKQPQAFKRDGDCSKKPGAPAGDYQITCHVIEARNLVGVQVFSLTEFKKNAISPDKLPNPYVQIRLKRVDGKVMKQRTPERRNSASPIFQSRHFFEIHAAHHELANTEISFRVIDHKLIGKKLQIGSVELELETVYNLTGNEIYRKWFTLTESKGRRQGGQGQICISLSVVRSGEKPVYHEESSLLEDADVPEGGQLGPVSSIDTELYHFHMKMYRARDLPRMDKPGPIDFLATTFGTAAKEDRGIDAKVKISCGSATVDSKTKTSRKPKWNQQISLNVHVPLQEGIRPTVRVEVQDDDTVGDSDTVAVFRLDMRDVVLNPEKWRMPRWRCLYGAPTYLETQTRAFEKQSKLHTKMNNNLVPGSNYRGMVLFSAHANIARKEIRTKRLGILDPEKKYTKLRWNVVFVEIVDLELYQLEEGTDGRVQVVVTCGKSRETTDWQSTTPGRKPLHKDCHVSINTRIQLPVLMPVAWTNDEEQAPDVFLEVWWRGPKPLGGPKRRVAYHRYPVSQLLPKVRVFEAGKALEAQAGSPAWPQEGWLPLTSDALSNRGRGSTRGRHARPIGTVLTRMYIQEVIPVPPAGDVLADVDEYDPEGSLSSSSSSSGSDTPFLRDLSDDEEQEVEKHVRVPRKLKTKIQPYPKQWHRVQIHLYQADQLPMADVGGLSDPYCVVRCGRQQTQTQVVSKSLCPSFFATVSFDVQMPLYRSATGITPATSHDKKQGGGVGGGGGGGSETGDGVLTAIQEQAELREDIKENYQRLEEKREMLLALGMQEDIKVAAYPEVSRAIRMFQGGGEGGEGRGDGGSTHRTGGLLTHRTGYSEQHNEMTGVGEAGPSWAAGVLPQALLNRPSMPQATDPHFKPVPQKGYDIGYDADEGFSVAESDISSTLSYVLGPDRGAGAKGGRMEGTVMWWAAPLVHLTVFDSDSVSKDDIICLCTFPLVEPQGAQPNLKKPLWVPLHPLHKVGSAGSVLVATETRVLSRQERQQADSRHAGRSLHPSRASWLSRRMGGGKQSSNGREEQDLEQGGGGEYYNDDDDEDDAHTSGPKSEQRVVKSRNKSLFDALTGGRGKLQSFGGPGVTRLDFSPLTAVPVQVDVVLVGLRQLDPLVKGLLNAPCVEIEVSGLLPLDDEDLVKFPLKRQSKPSNIPSVVSPNFNRQKLTIQGLLPLEPQVRLQVLFRVRETGARVLGVLGANTLELDLQDLIPDVFKKTREGEGFTTTQGLFQTTGEDGELEDDEESEDDDDDESSDEEMEDDDEEDGIHSIRMTRFDSGRRGAGSDAGRSRGSRGHLHNRRGGVWPPRPPRPDRKSFQGQRDNSEEQKTDEEKNMDKESEAKEEQEKLANLFEMEDFLRESKEMPFDSIEIYRGAARHTLAKDRINVASLKYIHKVRVLDKPKCDLDGTPWQYPLPPWDFEWKEEKRLADLLKPTKVMVRLYLVRGINLMPKDRNNLCDPYIVLELGNQKKSYRKFYKKATTQPKLFMYHDFKPVQVPGHVDITISVWDHDPTMGDDLIGQTTIDLEDRWFSPKYQEIRKRCMAEGSKTKMPLEKRYLYDSKNSQALQGLLEMQLEMYDLKTDDVPSRPETLREPDPEMVELRLVVWEAENVEAQDIRTLTSDLYVVVNLQGIDENGNAFLLSKKTDVHNRAADGRGSWNWRLVFRFAANKISQPRLQIQLYDHDMLKSNDNIGEYLMSIGPMVKKILDKDGPYEQADEVEDPPNGGGKWIQMFHPSDLENSAGDLKISITLMTEEVADREPVGEGRKEPNVNPKLPPPVREILSWSNPMDSLKYFIGPARLNQVLALICGCLLVVLAGGMVLVFANDFVAAFINSSIGGSESSSTAGATGK